MLPEAIRDRSDGPFARQGEMMSAFVRLFGDYPFEAPYRSVVTEDDLEIPLEAQGLSIFGANFLEDDWSTERLVAHELSHQWFGNSLTIRSWRDIWMHEGFACYSEWLWSEESGRESADGKAREHWKRLDDLPQDLLLGDPGPDDMFDDRVYKRGALLAARPAADDGRRDVLRLPARRGWPATATAPSGGASSPSWPWRSAAARARTSWTPGSTSSACRSSQRPDHPTAPRTTAGG